MFRLKLANDFRIIFKKVRLAVSRLCYVMTFSESNQNMLNVKFHKDIVRK